MANTKAAPQDLVPDDAKGIKGNPAKADVQLVDLGGYWNVAVQAGKSMLIAPASEVPEGETANTVLDTDQSDRFREWQSGSHRGLAGKVLATWILTGQSLAEQTASAKTTRKQRELALKAERATAEGRRRPAGAGRVDGEKFSVPWTPTEPTGRGYFAMALTFTADHGTDLTLIGFFPGANRTDVAHTAREEYGRIRDSRDRTDWPDPRDVEIVMAPPNSLRVTPGLDPVA